MSMVKNLIRNINYLTKHSLCDRHETDIRYLTDKILDDAIYEYSLNPSGGGWRQNPAILTQEESLDLIERAPKSFIRTGDGEIKLMGGLDQPFQKYEKEIAESLICSLGMKRDDMYIGINRSYFIPLSPLGNPAFQRRYAYDFRNFYKKYLNPNITYIDAAFTSFPIGRQRCPKYDRIYDRWKKLFRGRHIVLVCGDGILDGFQYDIFEGAAKKTIVAAPKINAWDEKESILSRIRTINKNNAVIVFILGMAGKAMIPILTAEGYMCWDVGHLAKFYNAYMTGMDGSEESVAKFYKPD